MKYVHTNRNVYRWAAILAVLVTGIGIAAYFGDFLTPPTVDNLMVSIDRTDATRVKHLLKRGAPVNSPDHNGRMPLIHAIETGSPDIVEALLDAHADISVKGPYGWSVLQTAFDNQSASIANLLVQHGADANGPLTDGIAPLCKAYSLLPMSFSEPPMPFSVTTIPDPEIHTLIQTLLDHGADPNTADTRYRPPVALVLDVMQSQDFDIAKLLVERGARLDCRDHVGKTPLHWAAYYGNGDMIRLLLARGASLDAQDDLGRTPLRMAQIANRRHATMLLQRKGATAPRPVAAPRSRLGQRIGRLILTRLPEAPVAGRVTYAIDKSPNGSTLLVKRQGQLIVEPITFGALFTDRNLWLPEEVQAHANGLGSCAEDRDAYELFGLVTIKERSYLGIFWSSGCESAHEKRTQRVFEIAVRGGALELTLLYSSSPIYDPMGQGIHGDPILTKSRSGDLTVRDGYGTFQYLPNGNWKQVGPPVKPIS
jgi:ankyrin repeat protein